MKLPEDSIIAVTTLVDDLLQPGQKAIFLASGGYTLENWGELETDLRNLLALEAVRVRSDARGNYYEINGFLKTLHVKTLWFWESGKEIPEFITFIPLS